MEMGRLKKRQRGAGRGRQGTRGEITNLKNESAGQGEKKRKGKKESKNKE